MSGLVALYTGAFFAQLDGPAPTTVVGALIVGFTGMTGLMVWIVKRLLDTTLPEMQRTFQQSLDRIMTGHQQALDRNAEIFSQSENKFHDALDRMAATFKEDFAVQTKIFASEEKELRDLFEKKLANERAFFAVKLDDIIKVFVDDRERFFQVLNHGQKAVVQALEQPKP